VKGDRPSTVPDVALAQRGAHIAALWGLAVVAPLLHLLGFHPEVFATRDWSPGAIVLFTVALTVAAPLALLGLEWLAGLFTEALGWALHLVILGALVAAIALQVLTLDAALIATVAALTFAIGAVLLYARSRATRSLLVVLSPAPLIFAALFLVFSDVSDLVFPQGTDVQAATSATPAPIVMVIFDELPVSSLMDVEGNLDARRFPNFARLAGDATWYRNTTSVDQDTPYALPAILDGRLPRQERLPVAADHAQNIFTALSPRYELHVREEATALCPPSLCPPEVRDDSGNAGQPLLREVGLAYAHMVLPGSLERDMQAPTEAWRRLTGYADTKSAVARTRRTPREAKRHRYARIHGNLARGRPARFEQFVAAIDGGSQPRLHLVHTLLPHVPFQYLPSGRFYRRSPKQALPGMDGRPGYSVRFLVGQSYARHLLQLQAADRLLGLLLDRLHESGLYRRAVVAVIADHGISFRLGHDRRLVRPANVAEIAPVPFLVKAPGQRLGRISDKPLRTVDVLPTVADLAGVRIPWRIDGRSALRSTVSGQRHRRIVAKKFRHMYWVDTPTLAADRSAALQRKKRLFGHGLYAFGPRRDLIGRRVEGLRLPAGSKARALIAGAGRFRNVDPGTGYVPTHVVGTVLGGRRGGGRTVALAVDGRIVATGVTFTLEGSHEEQFSLLMPEWALRGGANRLELVWVRGRRLQELGTSG
jgi:hypothetical protein